MKRNIVGAFASLLLLISGRLTELRAQYLHSAQPYATNLSINPAFAGMNSNMRFTLKTRYQWPQVSGAIISNQLMGDYRIPKSKSGLGLLIYQDQAGTAGLTRLEATASYAYHTRMTKKYYFGGGLGVGYGYQRLDAEKLVFGDQYSNNAQLMGPSQEDISRYRSDGYLSVNAGGVVYNNQFWFSLAGYHLNYPDQGFEGAPSYLPGKFVINTGYKLFINDYYSGNRTYELSLTPALIFTKEGGLRKLDAGLYLQSTPFHAGVILRGLPVGNEFGYSRSVTLLGGAALQHFLVAYSYDMPLGANNLQVGGAHELSLLFERVDYNKLFKRRVFDKSFRLIACPKF
jgi:type IX secretion system PorP/SprF family membrane protein